MSNDRELLELAAKAAGIPLGVYVVNGCDDFGCKTGFRLKDNQNYIWNPKDDDGDALRLAVKLRLTISWDRFDDDEYATATPRHTHQGYDCIAGSDPYAATRLAIVRAAAEIGRAMP